MKFVRMKSIDMIKTIAIFGSTGSIGINSLNIVRQNLDKFKVEILLANNNVELLAKQAIEFKPQYVGLVDETNLAQLKHLLDNQNIKIISGKKAASELAKVKVDITMMSIVGSSAIEPTINSIKTGNTIALANKECLVCAGTLITNLAKELAVKIIPVDSEHNGLFQIFNHNQPHLVKNVTLTASGGPFRDLTLEEMQLVTKSQALKHPNWSMGAKITIDSATLVNKCLEVIEAYYLFPIPMNQIKILIHPESIIHALATYIDGSILAQLSKPNMQIPISYALFYPERAFLNDFNEFDLANIARLNFHQVDEKKFKSLYLLKQIINSIQSNSSLIFNIANEIAVSAFLEDKIKFMQITDIIEEMLNIIPISKLNSLNEILVNIELVKQQAISYIKTIAQ